MAKELKVCKEKLADAQAQLGGLRQAVSDLKARVPKAKGTNGAGAYSMTHAPNWRIAARYWALAPTARSCERAAAAAASRDLLGHGAAAPFPPAACSTLHGSMPCTVYN